MVRHCLGQSSFTFCLRPHVWSRGWLLWLACLKRLSVYDCSCAWLFLCKNSFLSSVHARISVIHRWQPVIYRWPGARFLGIRYIILSKSKTVYDRSSLRFKVALPMVQCVASKSRKTLRTKDCVSWTLNHSRTQFR